MQKKHTRNKKLKRTHIDHHISEEMMMAKKATDGGKRAANYRAYLQKMTSNNKAPCVSNAYTFKRRS